MYQTLTFYHNSLRWLVLASLLLAIYRAYRGYLTKSTFSKIDNAVRHWTATIAHIQLMIGMILYFQSPLIKYFFANFKTAIQDMQLLFFGLLHSSLMLLAIILITIGSAFAKRKESDTEKFKTMMIWFTVALLILLIAIPWPFSPFASRPYFR
ncbi:hypothetical protein M8998_05030 [Sphingobacterium sp. lm-10]|uniref:hypothetical protein n=1 Tax=Sphingobacterium sp. lm-10 TaxID=2944904 RepID=UPI0020218D0B|nr:hypothetical protein [Sphingobacterium sp. lm-10]MCL7987302.1 hypothetical protein [Sphingobacterium sp. lm-10]